MKLLISSIVALLAGILSALLIPVGEGVNSFLLHLSSLSINIGRYIVFPMVFFSLAIAVCKLRREKKLIRTVLITALLIAASTVLLVSIGVLVTIIISPSRIPLIVETRSLFDLADQRNTFMSIFPQNMFTLFTGNSNVLLPIYFLSFILGFIMYRDKEVSEPAFNLFDSLSRILFELNMVISGISPVFLAFISFSLTRSIKSIPDRAMFSNLILILSISSAVIILIAYPLALYLTDRKTNPYKTLYNLILPLFHGLISGDSFFSLSILTRTLKKNLFISRKISALTLPLNAMFAKAGTALVTSVTFLTILKSYSSLEITLYQIFWVILFSILVSFTLASFPAMGVYTALYMLSEFYSRSHTGLTDSYLLIKPVVPLLIGFAVLIDVATSALITLIVSRKSTLE
ncbi:dicarboxylate/amino acid:cation symporter [Spirochaeta isovalerica]|uniref:Na+/H+-dicarboxylate symporter n=1 Tax=Spirochaeta isovalerica TaxID=150 RepID=A0A841RG44_9SPIO|nr:cation:dicarboxylase symporter family transporter [Spirochaeta isovalerica]MBB6482361.1 Na+/H+-dicarboxylate symporter [Spirochaeta isovalerica]